MASIKDMPPRVLILGAAGLVIALTVGAWFGLYKQMNEDNTTRQAQLTQLLEENKKLKAIEPELAHTMQRIEEYKQQLENMKKIMPDEKLADQFMHLMQETAAAAGIDIRRYTSKPTVSRDFYTEAPYEMEIDGSYYSVLAFFDKVAHLERIINVGTLKVATPTKAGDAAVRRTYAYAPSETVVATCVTTTFFSKENFTQGAPGAAATAPAPAAPAKK
jgi:type IV pilus assembly protein PilO